jgi:hypothetical protein
MKPETCDLLIDLLAELARGAEIANRRVIALELLLTEQAPTLVPRYVEIQGELQSHLPFSIRPEVFAELRKALLRE